MAVVNSTTGLDDSTCDGGNHNKGTIVVSKCLNTDIGNLNTSSSLFIIIAIELSLLKV